jgi:hypothetical protein
MVKITDDGSPLPFAGAEGIGYTGGADPRSSTLLKRPDLRQITGEFL